MEKEPPVISVVVPTYNREALIVDALESIHAQSWRPLEVIVVDDGSTDGTETIVREWMAAHEADDFQTHFLRQENQGGNVARNTGIEHARGALIAFLDSDDCWLPDKLAKQAPCFDDAQVAAAYCGVRHVDMATGESTEPTDRAYPAGDLLEALLVRDVTAQTSAYVVRKEAFEQAGTFDVSLRARQDWDMWIRLASVGHIACVQEALVDYREHNLTRTASNPQKEIDAYRAIRYKYATLRRERSLGCRLRARSSYYKRMGRVHHKHGLSRGMALGYGLGAVACWPGDFDAWAALAGMFLPKNLRANLHRKWNAVFGKTPLAIRSH